jgi:hypothetical protein
MKKRKKSRGMDMNGTVRRHEKTKDEKSEREEEAKRGRDGMEVEAWLVAMEKVVAKQEVEKNKFQ